MPEIPIFEAYVEPADARGGSAVPALRIRKFFNTS